MPSEASRVEKQRRRFDELERALRTFEPRVERAFLAAVGAVRSRVTLRELARAIEAGDLARAIELTGPERLAGALRGEGLAAGEATLPQVLTDALTRGSIGAQQALPRRLRLLAHLDLTNPEAVRYLRDHVPTLIQAISEPTRDAIRQQVLATFERGYHPRVAARQIRDTIGLLPHQQRYVDNFRRALETGQLVARETLPWQRRLSAVDRQRAKSLFLRAQAGSPAGAADVEALVQRYYASLVHRRAKDIARTETHRALDAGRDELWRQATEKGYLDPSVTRRVWLITPDERLREDHREVPRLNPRGVKLDEPFETPVGPVMGPRQSGNPGFDVNCRCDVALEFDE